MYRLLPHSLMPLGHRQLAKSPPSRRPPTRWWGSAPLVPPLPLLSASLKICQTSPLHSSLTLATRSASSSSTRPSVCCTSASATACVLHNLTHVKPIYNTLHVSQSHHTLMTVSCSKLSAGNVDACVHQLHSEFQRPSHSSFGNQITSSLLSHCRRYQILTSSWV